MAEFSLPSEVLQSEVQYIIQSQAGFYMKGVRVNAFSVQKIGYYLAALLNGKERFSPGPWGSRVSQPFRAVELWCFWAFLAVNVEGLKASYRQAVTRRKTYTTIRLFRLGRPLMH